MKLSRVKCRSRLSKAREWYGARPKSVIRNCKVRAIEQVEAFDQKFETDMFSKTHPATEAKVKRSKVETLTCVPADANRPVVVVCIEVPVVTGDDIEWKSGGIAEDIA